MFKNTLRNKSNTIRVASYDTIVFYAIINFIAKDKEIIAFK